MKISWKEDVALHLTAVREGEFNTHRFPFCLGEAPPVRLWCFGLSDLNSDFKFGKQLLNPLCQLPAPYILIIINYLSGGER